MVGCPQDIFYNVDVPLAGFHTDDYSTWARGGGSPCEIDKNWVTDKYASHNGSILVLCNRM